MVWSVALGVWTRLVRGSASALFLALVDDSALSGVSRFHSCTISDVWKPYHLCHLYDINCQPQAWALPRIIFGGEDSASLGDAEMEQYLIASSDQEFM